MELPKGAGVFKVSNYEFTRATPAGIEMVRIRVKQNIGKLNGTFLAIPEKETLGEIVQAKNEYIGEGVSEDEAIERCIVLIKDASFSSLFKKDL